MSEGFLDLFQEEMWVEMIVSAGSDIQDRSFFQFESIED